jgi:hypothetical protein
VATTPQVIESNFSSWMNITMPIREPVDQLQPLLKTISSTGPRVIALSTAKLMLLAGRGAII